MARKNVEIHAGEAEVMQEFFRERDLANKALTAITQLICARENIPIAILAGLAGTTLQLDVPDDLSRTGDPAPVVPLKLDRTESPPAAPAPAGAIPVAPDAETPADATPAVKTDDLEALGAIGSAHKRLIDWASPETPEIHEHATGG